MPTKKDDSQQPLPTIACLIIRSNGRIVVENLDEYVSDDERKEVFLDALDKFGEQNVRFCKVLSARIKREVELI